MGCQLVAALPDVEENLGSGERCLDDENCAEGLVCERGQCARPCDPSPELCNGLDDDCDPTTSDGADEDWLGSYCDGDDEDLCEEGTWECSSGTRSCSEQGDAAIEECNDRDDDCDGDTDEGFECRIGAEESCTNDFGIRGSRTCSSSCSWGTCLATETCNGRDDDGDGDVDEECPCANGWAWENPLPQGNPLRSVWVAPDGPVFAVGDIGTILHGDGSSWTRVSSGTTNNLNGVWGTSSRDVWAVGANGTVLHYDGTSWDLVETGVSEGLNDVWGIPSSGELYVVGGADDGTGVILHWTGASWEDPPHRTPHVLLGVHGSSEDRVFVVGLSGLVLEWNGMRWSDVDLPVEPTENLHDIWCGPRDDEAIIVGWDGENGFVLELNDTVWSRLVLRPSPTPMLNDIWVGEDGVAFIVGAQGAVRRSRGDRWEPVVWEGNRNLWGVSGDGDGHVYAVGAEGIILRREDEDDWRIMSSTSENLVQLRSVWGSSSEHVYAVGRWGVVLRRNGTSWERMVTPDTNHQLTDLWGSTDDDIYAVGYIEGEAEEAAGLILHWDGTAWSDVELDDPLPGLNAVWGSSSDDFYAVGANGVMTHWDGTRWERVDVEVGENLREVWGSSDDDVFVVGEMGTILHWDGERWERMESGTLFILNSIWGHSSFGVYTAGNSPEEIESILLRHEGGLSWSPVGWEEDPMLVRDIWGRSTGEIFLVGFAGKLLRWNRTTWAEERSGTSWRLYGIWGSSDDNVFIVGDHGTILHRCGTGW